MATTKKTSSLKPVRPQAKSSTTEAEKASILYGKTKSERIPPRAKQTETGSSGDKRPKR